MTLKKRYRQTTWDWIKKIRAYTSGNYPLSKFENHVGQLEITLNRFSLKELSLINALICAAYSASADESREWYRQFKEYEKKNLNVRQFSDSDRSKFKVIQGGG